MFVIVDGIDGSGKGTVVQALMERRRKDGARVFDVRAFTREQHRLPEPEELDGFTLLVTGEPTYAWVGAAIRDEMVRANRRAYSARCTAEAFALDRLLHYRRVLLPARERGMDIIAERSVTSTLVYQQQQSAGNEKDVNHQAITLEETCALEGNRVALANPPDLLLLLSVDPSRALRRLDLRIDKQDDSLFERLATLEALHAGFRAPAFRQLLAQYHWRIAEVDANGAVEDAVAASAMRVDEMLHNTAMR